MATECARCGKLLVSTVENPTIALTCGWFHDRCYNLLQADREEEAHARAEAAAEEEAKRNARRIEIQAQRSQRMRERWAKKRGE